MKAVVIENAFGLDNLAVTERPEPDPGPGQVVVKVHAASLNYRDLLTVQGFYNPRQPLPLVPLSDGAGEVVAVGPGVTRVKVGDRVAGAFAQGWISGRPSRAKLLDTTLGGPLDGMLREFALLGAEGVVHIPDHLSYEEAATLPCAGLTAWSALVRHGDVKPGDVVLVLGTGGVSIFALQFAKLLGATVIVTSSSNEKLERAKALGAHHCVNYRENANWAKTVRELTGGEGVDHVIEVGGVGTLTQSMRAVRMGGTISLIGVLAGAESSLNLTPLLMQDIRLQGVIVGHRESFEEMNRAIAARTLKPAIDRVFAFEEAKESFELMASGGHFGKICIRVSH
ncbi:MAG: NAD(P)-dependent alcohol dehydrogenase [Candidatus Hydrogenedentes bacterium]|nr:NAD(P)-dependent alcohol dehydrogenase [Candidatus Hydrogenedentota bacterium]